MVLLLTGEHGNPGHDGVPGRTGHRGPIGYTGVRGRPGGCLCDHDGSGF